MVTVGGTNTSGTVYYTGQITIGTDGGTSVPLTITAAAGGTVEIDGNIVRRKQRRVATDIVTKIGGGTLVRLPETTPIRAVRSWPRHLGVGQRQQRLRA